MNTTLLWAAASLVVINWFAAEKQWKAVEYIAKPGTMAALFLWLWLATGLHGPALFFGLGLLLSLAGDVLLMLPSRPFVAGLVAFLLAHVSYIVGFNPSIPPLNLGSLLLAVAIGFIAWRIYLRLEAGLKKCGEAALCLPVLFYTITISLMALSAALTQLREDWALLPALLAGAGGMLFMLSDTLLAWNQFVSPLSHQALKVMVTYHLAQFAIIAGVVLNLQKGL